MKDVFFFNRAVQICWYIFGETHNQEKKELAGNVSWKKFWSQHEIQKLKSVTISVTWNYMSMTMCYYKHFALRKYTKVEQSSLWYCIISVCIRQ